MRPFARVTGRTSHMMAAGELPDTCQSELCPPSEWCPPGQNSLENNVPLSEYSPLCCSSRLRHGCLYAWSNAMLQLCTCVCLMYLSCLRCDLSLARCWKESHRSQSHISPDNVLAPKMTTEEEYRRIYAFLAHYRYYTPVSIYGCAAVCIANTYLNFLSLEQM